MNVVHLACELVPSLYRLWMTVGGSACIGHRYGCLALETNRVAECEKWRQLLQGEKRVSKRVISRHVEWLRRSKKSPGSRRTRGFLGCTQRGGWGRCVVGRGHTNCCANAPWIKDVRIFVKLGYCKSYCISMPLLAPNLLQGRSLPAVALATPTPQNSRTDKKHLPNGPPRALAGLLTRPPGGTPIAFRGSARSGNRPVNAVDKPEIHIPTQGVTITPP